MLAGWATTEVGRQPWTVYGLLRTADSVTPSLTGWNVLVSLLGYVVAYAIIFPAGGLVMARIVRAGPSEAVQDEPVESGRPRSVGARGAGSAGRRRRRMSPPFDFVPVWTCILGIGVFFYVLLDGFDLGVGILYGRAPDRESRNLMMNAIAPVWDGNETWLVLGGLGLLAAFPLAYVIIIPAVYFPIAIMLLALIFRGVAFEFRYRDSPHRGFWDHGFAYGSTIATFAQGIVLGAFIQGFQTDGHRIHRQQPGLLHAVLAGDRVSAWCSAMRCSAPAGWC